jgi:hypothetical protein
MDKRTRGPDWGKILARCGFYGALFAALAAMAAQWESGGIRHGLSRFM